MNDEKSSIHDFEFDLICDYFTRVPRQGPGDDEATLRALCFVEGLDENSRIADLGCGTGTQTLTLAEHTAGQITGVDLFPKFVEMLNARAAERGLSERVKGVVGSMDDLKFEPESLNLIWSEGAIYNIGFQKGLAEWRKYLKKGGYIAVTEISWFTDERPREITDFWMDAYSEIDTIPNKVAQLQSAGYVPVASFILPEKCWVESFYKPQERAQEEYLAGHRGDKTAEELIRNQRAETELYMKYKDYYGYVFYIGKKI